MTLLEIKNLILFQTNHDADELGDFMPHLNAYINDGYDRLVHAWCGEHVSPDSEIYLPLRHDRSMPELPEWTHAAIADWATWLIYRNGSAARQNRGTSFKISALGVLDTIRQLSDAEKKVVRTNENAQARYFRNFPR